MRFCCFLLVLTLVNVSCTAQKNEKILGFLKSRSIDSVLNHCIFPFDLSAGSMIDDNAIVDKEVLRKKLRQLFKENYFAPLLKGKRTVKGNAIYIESKSFNNNGELESESTMIFDFKKSKEGEVKLYRIILAG